MTRDEHMAWCKKRAHEYLDRGDVPNAVTSMASDLGKHPDTAGHPGIDLGMMLMMTGNLAHPTDARRFIDGFN
jgi:hypothetical protein